MNTYHTVVTVLISSIISYLKLDFVLRNLIEEDGREIKMGEIAASPQIHKKLIKIWNSSYKATSRSQQELSLQGAG